MLKQKTLTERIKQIQEECDALIDARVVELKKDFDNIPLDWLRRDIELKALPGCPCKQALKLLEVE